MAKYTINMTGESSARFHYDVDIDGYVFNSLPPAGNNMFVVKKVIDAKNWRAAMKDFNSKFEGIADALAFHRQSAISSYGVSTIITKDGSNLALALLTKQSPGIGLSLAGHAQLNEQEEILALSHHQDVALGHFRSSMLATGGNSITFDLIRCAESLAGSSQQSVKCPSCRHTLKCAGCQAKYRPTMTNHSRLKVILGNVLYDFYYKKQGSNPKSYRNMLAHGDYVDEFVVSEKVDDLYEVIKVAIKTKYSLNLMSGITGVRNLHGYGKTNVFIEYDVPLPSPPDVVEMVDSHEIGHNTSPYRIDFSADNVTLDSF